MSPKRIWLAVQVLVTLGLVYLLFRSFEWERFWGVLGRTPAWLYLASFAVVAGGQLLYALKWQLVLWAMGMRLPYREVAEHYLVGVFFNNFLPTMIGGDWARIYYLGQRAGYVDVGASVVMDRFLGLFSLSLVGTLLAWTLPFDAVSFVVGRSVLTAILGLFVAVFVVALVAPVERLRARRPAGRGLVARAADVAGRLLGQAQLAARAPGAVVGVIAIVLIYVGALAWVYREFFRGAADPEPGLIALLASIVMIAVLSNVPVTVNGIGLREQLHYLLFAALAVPKEVSVSLSLLIFAHGLVVSAGGYLLWLRWKVAWAPR